MPQVWARWWRWLLFYQTPAVVHSNAKNSSEWHSNLLMEHEIKFSPAATGSANAAAQRGCHWHSSGPRQCCGCSWGLGPALLFRPVPSCRLTVLLWLQFWPYGHEGRLVWLVTVQSARQCFGRQEWSVGALVPSRRHVLRWISPLLGRPTLAG